MICFDYLRWWSCERVFSKGGGWRSRPSLLPRIGKSVTYPLTPSLSPSAGEREACCRSLSTTRFLMALGLMTVLAAGVQPVAAGCISAPAGVVGWWPADGTANDIARSNNGALQGGATATGVGMVGSAFSFDGTNGYVAIPDSPALRPTTLTVEAWVRFSSLESAGNAQAGQQYIIFKQNTRSSYFEGYYLGKVRIGGGDFFTFITASANAPAADQMAILQSAAPLATGVWYHVAGVRGTNYAEFYVNGQLQGHTNATFAQDYGSYPLYFGSSGESYWDGKFSGLLDEVAIYDHALSSDEIAAVYAAGASGKCKAPGFTAQPQTQSVVVGDSALLTVTATGFGPLAYQWQFNGTNLAGATAPNLALGNVQPANAGSYAVVVTNALGSATSSVATLTVVCAITVGPTTLPGGLVGNAYNQSLSASGGVGPYSFAVTAGALPAGIGLSANGALSGMPAAIGTNSFTVTARDSIGCSGSQLLTLAVTGAPPVIAVQPQSRTNVLGTDASFSVTGSGTPAPGYQWQFNGVALAGATASSLVRSAVSFADAGAYRVVLANVAGAATSAVATLTVICPAVTVGPAALPACVVGNAYSQSLTASGGLGPYSFALMAGALPAGLSLSGAGVMSGTPSVIGTNSFSVTATDANGCSGSRAYSLAVLPAPPVITLQPQSRTNVAGTAATFSATAAGTTPLGYQWVFNGANLGDDGFVAGSRSNSLGLAVVQPADAGSYTLVVSNVAGVVTSAVATLTVMVPPAIQVPPASRSVAAGTATALSVTASGTTPLSYQWSLAGGDIAGATGASLILSNIQLSNAGGYGVVVANAAGAVTSAIATLTVTSAPAPPSITSQPASLSVVAGSSGSLSVTASGAQPLSYQWQFNGLDLGGATGTNLLLDSVQPTNAGSYTVVISNVAQTVTSAVAVLTVLVPPSISAQPASAVVAAGVNVSFGVRAAGTQPLNYQWQHNGASLAGANGADLLLTNAQPSDAGSYTVTVSNTVGVVTSTLALLTVNVPPLITAHPASQTVTSGTGVSFGVAASGTDPLGYQWQCSGTNLSDGGQFRGATTSTLSLSNVQPANAGSYSVFVTNVAGSAASAVASLTVVPAAGCAAVADGLAGWWPGDGSAADIAGTNNGTLQGGASASAAGQVGSAFSFDGTNGYVQVPDSPTQRPTNFTVEAWVAFSGLDSAILGTTPAGDQYIVFKQNSRTYYFEGYSLEKSRVANGDAFMFTVTSAAGEPAVLFSQTLVRTSVWYHVAAVRGTNFTELYVNGQLEARTNVTFAQDYGNLPLYFGTSAESYWDGKLRGWLDEVSLYNRALSASEVAAIYTAGAGGKCRGPNITGQPQSLRSVVGSNTAFSVTASGVGTPGYQWRFNGGDIAGATGAALSLTNVQLASAGSYAVVVTNGGGSVTSAVATLDVWAPPAIGSQPQDSATTLGTDATFTVAASGTPTPAYQWWHNGGIIPGATGSTLLRSAVSLADAGSYWVVAGNWAGSVTSAVVTLTVVCPSLTIGPAALAGGGAGYPYSQGLGASGGQGPYTFAVSAGALPLDLSLNSAGVLSGTPAGVGTNSFVVMATDANGCAGSLAYTLSVTGTPPVLTLQPQSRTNTAGTAALFAGSATGTAPVSYEWRFNGIGLADNGLISGARSGTLLIGVAQSSDAGGYALIASNGGGAITSAVATLTVLVPPGINVPPASRSASLGANVDLAVTASGTLPLSYQWQFNGSNMGGASGAELMLGGVQLTNAGSYTAVVTNMAGSVTSAVAVLTVLTPPAIMVPPASTNVLAGANVTFTVTASGTPPLGYQWRFNGTDIGGGAADLGLANVQPDDAGSYSVVVTNAAGSVTSAVAVLTVSFSSTCTPAATGVVGWWTGDGDANDSASTNNGTLQDGATATAAGMVGSAFGFDGANAYVSIADSPVLRPTNLTVEAWVWFDSLDTPASGSSPAGEQYLVFKENTHPQAFEGYALTKERVSGRDVFSSVVSSAAGQSAQAVSQSVVTTGAWYHVAAVRGATTLQLYVNGQLEGQANVSFTQDYGNYPLLFGSSGQPTWDHKLAGRLDEVSLYNVALSSDQIAAIYAAQAGGKCKRVTIVAQPQGGSVAAGGSVSLSVTAAGSAPLLYQWQRNGTDMKDGNNVSGASTATLSLANVALSDSASYRVIITNTLNAATSAVAVLEVVGALEAPAITNQPASQTVAAGTDVMLSVGASGSLPLGYQWLFNGTNLADGAQVNGVNGSTLSLSYVLAANSGGYSVVVSNGAGATTSAVATLTVSLPTGCLTPPAGLVGWWPGDGSARDIAGTNDGTLQGNAIANAAGFNGQAFSFDGTNGFVQIPDSPAFHPTNLSVECWVRFDAYQTPGDTYYSNQQYIVFKQNSRYAEFEGFALTKDHDPQGDVFLWEVASASGELIRIDSISTVVTGVWYHVVGVRGPDYVQLYKDGQLEVQTNVTFVQDYGTYPLYFGTSGQSYYDRRLHGELDEVSLYNRALSAGEIAALYAAGAAGKCKGTNGLSITAQPQSQRAAPGSDVVFSVGATGVAPLGYQWQFNGASMPGATTTSLTLTSVQPTNAGEYRAVVNNPAGLGISDAAVLTVGDQPSVTLQPTNEIVLVGGTASLSALVTGSEPLGCQWLWDGTNLPGAVAQTLSLTNVQPGQAGGYSVVVTNSAGSATSVVAVVIVAVPPVLLNPRTAANGGFTFTLNGATGLVYAIEVSTDLKQWTGVTFVTNLTSRADFTDSATRNSVSRFYRARLTY